MDKRASKTRRYFLAANWKSTGTTHFVKDIVTNLINSFEYDTSKLGKQPHNKMGTNFLNNIDLVILPGALHISLVKAMISPTIPVGAQDVSAYGPGAYTGEVAAEHLVDYGIDWVLIGHSQRRLLFGETQETVEAKVTRARSQGMGVILCLGENLEQREKELTGQVLSEQLQSFAKALNGNWENVVIAYEPIWAMGTGRIASADQTQEAHELIRKWVAANVNPAFAEDQLRIIYAGSVTETNCDNLIKLGQVDGFLVGTSSTKPAFRYIFDTVFKQASKDLSSH